MRILVTGATGFVGSHLVEALAHSGHQVTCLVRERSSRAWLETVPHQAVVGSLDDAASLAPAVDQQEAIIHCAGLVRSVDDEAFFRVNADGTERLAQAAVDHAPKITRFVLVSSQAAVGPAKNGQPVDETTAPNPIDRYGRSKLKGEEVAKRFADRLPLTIVRPSAIYGPRDRDIFLIFKAIHHHLRPVVGRGTRRLNLTHVDDIVQGIVLALEQDAAIGQTYMISHDQSESWLGITATLAQAMQRWAILFSIPTPLVSLLAATNEAIGRWTGQARTFDREKARVMLERAWLCDVSKAKRELGFAPAVSLRDGAAATYLWYQEQGWL